MSRPVGGLLTFFFDYALDEAERTWVQTKVDIFGSAQSQNCRFSGHSQPLWLVQRCDFLGDFAIVAVELCSVWELKISMFL